MQYLEKTLSPEARTRLWMTIGLIGVLTLISSACASTEVQASALRTATTTRETRTQEVLTTPTETPELILPIGLLGEDIRVWSDIDLQTTDFRVDEAPNEQLIRYLFDFKELVYAYEDQQAGNEGNPYLAGQLFREYVEDGLAAKGYDLVMQDPEVKRSLAFLRDYYKNSDTENRDGYAEPVTCVGAQIFAGSTRDLFPGAPVSTIDSKGHALALAAQMLLLPDGARAGDIADGVVVRLPKDRFTVELAKPGDTVAIRYGDLGGHELVILGKAHNANGELMVLVFDANRVVYDATVQVDGMARLRWMTGEVFSEQHENEFSQAVIIRPSSQ